jgi:hypothetical protein
LAGRWPPGNDGRLSTESKAKLTVMLREHGRALGMGTSTLKRELRIILKDEQVNDRSTATGGITWQEATSSGLSAASTVDRNLRGLLTVSDAPLSLDQAVPKLQQGFDDLGRAVEELMKSLNLAR